ncbi:DUF72 domain-containing protein [Paracoccus sp. S3-43]|uniref:DUF72 domain-containing protein n=1 Tax=Paracoccus sp. S3-43 TaxID=3030011 RepID=UPI0023B04BE1|nr:DUF72 domain-containing protein [Paracoccus sp. S3-43]WEF25154.1 DUF72 domain-containing protein [Paracoccus sp. S3-43]
MIRIGIGGWTFAPWRGGAFYPDDLPQRRELEYASRRLTSIEINATYYGSQKPESFQKWHDETPEDFVFALKGPRFATNRKVLAEAGDSVARFLDSGIARLGAKLGPLNWQLAETKTFDPQDFAAFLALLPASHDGLPLRHAVEARHDSFAGDEAAALCRDRGVALVRALDSKFPEIAADTADFGYWRLMGTTDRANGYADADLDRWADMARRAGKDRDLYLYVISGEKARNPAAAMALIDRLKDHP